MVQIRLTQETTRESLRAMHEQISAAADGSVTLQLSDSLSSRTPGQYGAWMQLVLTWGQTVNERPLVLERRTFERMTERGSVSDIELLAVFLATKVLVEEQDVTTDAQSRARVVLKSRKTLTAHRGDGGAESMSLLLAAHTFSNRTSPDLHAPSQGELAVEETARTLYHDLWPLPAAPETLRAPLTEFGEVTVPHPSPHIRRTRDDGQAAPTLGARAPRVRGLALGLATRVRQQPKPLHDEVGEILFELVQNTEWHASTWPGGRTGANCRAVTFREYRYTREDLEHAAEFDPQFVTYARAAVDNARDQTRQRVDAVAFGAVTVIDSGVGLARSVALSFNEDHLLNAGTEISYLIEALRKNLKRRRLDLGNIGLSRVQQSLTNLSGFMSIRTGNVELLRDFVARPFEPLTDRPQKPAPPLVLDWIPPLESDFVVGPRVGTAVTIVYPVEFEHAR